MRDAVTSGAALGATLDPPLAERVRAWIADDPDGATAAELAALLRVAAGEDGGDAGPAREAAARELADRFAGTLAFGTAGLRGRLGGGPNRMNRAVVIRAAAGLTAFLREELRDVLVAPGSGPRVVVGYDARRGSQRFALDTAGVVTAGGGTALLLPRALPTPVLAFAVRHLAADAGVMVTASHNPREDNGYKVYLGGRVGTGAGQGAQIVPPADARIAARIADAPPAAGVPRALGGWRVLDEEVVEAYLGRVVAGVRAEAPGRDLRIVLTPMHGVGGDLAVRALAAAGFTDVHLVPQQAAPDPEFPTLPFPNPEEPGAIDLLLVEARRRGADLALALDPDADRCAAAVPDPGAVGGWRALTGDEVGALLGERAAESAPPGAVLACSVVSSRLLGRIARAHGLEHRVTLTGFKWIARVPGLVFGYEEALGYCVDPEAVRDKDGIAAAVRVADLAASRRAAGSDLLAALDDLALAHGVHATAPLTVRVADLGLIGATMARLRAQPPTGLGGSAVVEVTDLALGSADLPPTDALVYLTAAGDRVVVRPSGTEPTIKCYLEAVVPVVDGALRAARTEAARRLAALREDIAATAGLPA